MTTLVFCVSLMGSVLAAEPGITRVAKAAPDEFYTGLGRGYYPLGQEPVGLPGRPKVNQAYLWGMTKAGDDLWFGTAANPVALVIGGLLGLPLPTETPLNAYEFGRSQFPGIPQAFRSLLGDWRPPRVYRYRPGRGLDELTPDDALIDNTTGLRSAGATDDVVLLAGPALTQVGINLFAFDAATGDFLGSKTLLEFSDIRQWVRHQGVTYTGVLDTFPTSGAGSVLRWRGTRSDPFRYEVVGKLDNEAATLAIVDDRLYALTWAQVSPLWQRLFDARAAAFAGVWVSPKISADGLTAAQQRRWKKVFSIDQSDPDPVLARSVWMGAATGFDGHLVWGTLQIPGLGTKGLIDAYNGIRTSNVDLETSVRYSLRTASLFRGRLDDREQFHVELLYGDATLPVFTPLGKRDGNWAPVANRIGPPRLGPAGFGEPNNAYIWAMTAYEQKLYIGTFDESLVLFGKDYAAGLPVPATLGADLVVMTASDQPARVISRSGLGAVTNNGVRTMVPLNGRIYLGTATGANLLTDPNDGLDDGGWELLELDPAALVSRPLVPTGMKRGILDAKPRSFQPSP